MVQPNISQQIHTCLKHSVSRFIITEEFQREIPLTNWMFPVNPNVKLPDSFDYAPKPSKSLTLPSDLIQRNQDQWIEGWLEAVTR